LRRQVFRWSTTSKLRQCLTGWRLVIQERKQGAERLGKIREYLEKRKMILVVAGMRECCVYQKEIREAYEEVSKHNARRVQRSVIRLWSYNYV
jgi:hypothetical protein